MSKTTGLRRVAQGEKSARSHGQGNLRRWLEGEIVSGRLRPGDRIDEKELCGKFGVSRTPVREAILQLASIGLVALRPRQGAIVARISVRQIVAMWEVLGGLEGLCAELAARRMSPDMRAELSKVHEETKKFVGQNLVEAYDEANRRFHELIYAGAQNDYLAQSVREIRKRMQPYRRLPFQRAGGIERSFAGHENVVKAIVAGDEKTAHAAMREHVAGGFTFLDFIAELPAHLTEDEKSAA